MAHEPAAQQLVLETLQAAPPEPEESPEKYLNAWPASNLGAYSVVLGQGPGVGTLGLEDPSEPLAGLSISAFQPRGHP